MPPYPNSYKLAHVLGFIADKTDKVHYQNLLGFADVEAKQPMREHNVFWIASMTKMFAVASIMMLVDERELSHDHPVTKFILQLDKWMVVEEKPSCFCRTSFAQQRRVSAFRWQRVSLSRPSTL